MTRTQRTAIFSALAVVIALLFGLFGGYLDGVLRQIGVEIAGRPAPSPATSGQSDVPATTLPGQEPAAGAADAAITERVVPIFDLVRVEPTGDAVIAGQGTAGATVQILSGEDVVASGTANAAGEWAIVLDRPLATGAHDLRARVTAPDGSVLTSEQSVAVSVPEGGTGEVLVVLNQPGAASTVLQIPEPEPAVEPAPEPAAVATAAPAAPADPSSAAATEVAEAPAAAALPPAAAPPGGDVPPPTSSDSPTPASPSDPTSDGIVVTSVMPDPVPPPTPGEFGVTPIGEAAPSDAAAVDSGISAPSATAETAPAVSGGASVAIAAVPPEAATSPAAEAAAASDTTVVAVAPVAEPAPAPVVVPAAPEAAIEPAAVPAGSTPAPALPVTVEAVELENGTRLYAAGSAPEGSVIRLYVDDTPVADARTMESGRWLVETELALEPGDHRVRADQVDASGAVISRAEVAFSVSEDPLQPPTGVAGTGVAALGSGTSGEARIAPGQSVIIRRGDNLWTIAKRLYGQGVRYSTIYEANTDQIRDANLIYPGQVFVIPEGDTNWIGEGRPVTVQ